MTSLPGETRLEAGAPAARLRRVLGFALGEPLNREWQLQVLVATGTCPLAANRSTTRLTTLGDVLKRLSGACRMSPKDADSSASFPALTGVVMYVREPAF